MRKKLIILLVLIVLFATTGTVHASPLVILNGQVLKFDVPPIIEEGRTLVPFRSVFEALGADVKWNGETQTVTATKGITEIKLVIGGEAYKNGQAVHLDVPAKIVDSRTMVPLRFISEALDYYVNWDEKKQIITIVPPNIVMEVVSPSNKITAFAVQITEYKTDVYLKQDYKTELILTVAPKINKMEWSPDGNYLLVSKITGSEFSSADIYSMEDKNIISISFLCGPFWSPDCTRLAISRFGESIPNKDFPTSDAVIFDIKKRTYERFAKGNADFYYTVDCWESDGRIKYNKRPYSNGLIIETLYYDHITSATSNSK